MLLHACISRVPVEIAVRAAGTPDLSPFAVCIASGGRSDGRASGPEIGPERLQEALSGGTAWRFPLPCGPFAGRKWAGIFLD